MIFYNKLCFPAKISMEKAKFILCLYFLFDFALVILNIFLAKEAPADFTTFPPSSFLALTFQTIPQTSRKT